MSKIARPYLLWDLAELGEAVLERHLHDAKIQKLTQQLVEELTHSSPDAPHTSAPSIQQTTSSPFDVLRKISIYRGLYTRVARKLGVTPSVVRRVALNKSKSARISKALEIEILKFQGESTEAHI